MQLERPRHPPQSIHIAHPDNLGSAPLPPDFSAVRNGQAATTPATSQAQSASAADNTVEQYAKAQHRISNASIAQDVAAKELLTSLAATEKSFIETLHSLLRRNFASAVRSSVQGGALNEDTEAAGLRASTSSNPSNGEQTSDEDRVLQPLLEDLRKASNSLEDPFVGAEMRQVIANSKDGSGALQEIRTRLDYLAPYFPSTASNISTTNAQAAKNLSSMLGIIRRLQSLYKASPFLASSHKLATPLPTPGVAETRFSFDSVEDGSLVSEASQEIYSALHKQAKVLQSASLTRQDSQESTNVVRAVEEAEVELLWGRLDDLLDSTMEVFKLQQQPTRTPSTVRRVNHDYLFGTTPAMTSDASAFEGQHALPAYSSLEPPSYDSGNIEDENELFADEKGSLANHRQQDTRTRTATRTPAFASDEKMQLDLDRMASAIERLYISAPQLANQRVDPVRRNDESRQQLREIQLAKLGTAIERLCKGRMEDQRASLLHNESNPFATARSRSKSKEQDLKKESLDKLLDEIDNASARTLIDQRASMSSKHQNALAGARRTARLAAADLNLEEDEIQFRDYLIESASKGRLTSQDATFSGNINGHSSTAQATFASKMASKRLSLAQMFEENGFAADDEKRDRMRSNSVGAVSLPPMSAQTNGSSIRPPVKKRFSVSRLLAGAKESSTALTGASSRKGSKSISNNSRPTSAYGAGLSQFIYTIEEMTNLGSMVVQAWEDLPQHADPPVTAEPLSIILVDAKTAQLTLPDVASSADESTKMQLTSNAQAALVGQKPLDLLYKADHYEIKIPTAVSTQFTRNRDDLEIAVPYSAQDFRTHQPSSLSCTSCGAELADLSQIKRYNDLPSEHWAELLDAWMCHPDQTLSKDIIDKGNNIWPQRNQALISTTGIVLATENTLGWVVADEIEPVHQSDGKWLAAKCKSCRALVGRSSPGPTRDISEKSAYVRFTKLAIQPSSTSFMPVCPLPLHVTSTLLETSLARAIHRFVVEDEEEGRNQIIMWVFNPYIRLFSNHTSFESSTSVNAVKILYKAGKVEDSDLIRLIGNAEHETLIYPRGVCLQLAELLQASTSIYPRSHQKLGEWDVGWLERDIGRR